MSTLTFPHWDNAPDTTPDHPTTDKWGNKVTTYTDTAPEPGTGEKSQCTQCGGRHTIHLYAATKDSNTDKFQEFYVCTCGATGTFTFNPPNNKWDGQIKHPENVNTDTRL